MQTIDMKRISSAFDVIKSNNYRCGSGNGSRNSVQEHQLLQDLKALPTVLSLLVCAPTSSFGDHCASGRNRNTTWERSRSVQLPLLQLKQRPGALQEQKHRLEPLPMHSVPGSSSCSVGERCRSVAEIRKQQLHFLGAQHRRRGSKQQRRSIREPGPIQKHSYRH